jgi:hypothetical protein
VAEAGQVADTVELGVEVGDVEEEDVLCSGGRLVLGLGSATGWCGPVTQVRRARVRA